MKAAVPAHAVPAHAVPARDLAKKIAIILNAKI